MMHLRVHLGERVGQMKMFMWELAAIYWKEEPGKGELSSNIYIFLSFRKPLSNLRWMLFTEHVDGRVVQLFLSLAEIGTFGPLSK